MLPCSSIVHLARNEQITRLIGTGAELFARFLDKDSEHEADKLAMILAARAGYDPFGLPMVLEALGQRAGSDRGLALLFKTHPSPEERLFHLEATGLKLEGIQGRSNRSRFYRMDR